MSILRVGSNNKYAANWGAAFGTKKKVKQLKKKPSAVKKTLARKKTRRARSA